MGKEARLNWSYQGKKTALQQLPIPWGGGPVPFEEIDLRQLSILIRTLKGWHFPLSRSRDHTVPVHRPDVGVRRRA